MRAFITGSHAYGEPNEKSDVDLVIMCDESTMRRLHELAGIPIRWPLRFGNLNLVCCTDSLEFEAWEVGTRRLIAIGEPCGKNFAKGLIKAELLSRGCRRMVGVSGK